VKDISDHLLLLQSSAGIWGITASPQALFGFQSLDFMPLFLLSHLPNVWPSVGCIMMAADPQNYWHEPPHPALLFIFLIVHS
jgi:hypothetical protein